MSGLSYVLAASICIWLAIFGYLAYLQLRLLKLQGKVDIILKENK